MITFKKIGAVFAGFLTVVILSIATDAALEKGGIFPEQGLFVTWMLVLAFFYRSVYDVIGGYVTARLSPERPERQVMVLGILGTLGGMGGVIYGWDMSDHWYPIALAVTAYPLTTFGGKIWMKKMAS